MMTLPMPDREPCPFCSNLEGSADCTFVYRDDVVASFVNQFQLEHGALLVVPIQHFTSALDIPEEVLTRVYSHARNLARSVVKALGATGVNVFQNNGLDAGQTIPHFHVHVLPRFPGGDPEKVFNAKNAIHISISQQQEIADAVKRVLG